MATYSQISQDVFVLNFFKKSPGFFLDLGCGNGWNKPCGNNSLLLEKNGWDGLSVDFNPDHIKEFQANRKTKAVCADLMKTDLKSLMVENGCPQVIDYLSFDIDDATEFVFKNFPLNDFKFKFITFEHNLYMGGKRDVDLKAEAIEKFSAHGYTLMVENVTLEDHGVVEDWFINSNLVRENKKIFLKDMNHREILKTYDYDQP